MNDMSKNVKSETQWLRGLFMLLYFVVYEIAEMVVIFVAVLQFLFSIVTGNNNQNLRRFGSSLGKYAREIVDYITYNNESKPFPFAEWPEPDVTPDQPIAQESDEQDPPTTGS